MKNQQGKVFVYDEDGLFEIQMDTDAGDLTGGIQISNGPIAVPGEASGAFCHNKDTCK